VQTRRRAVILVTVIGLLAISGLAMADAHFDEDDDGVFNFGADSGPDEEEFLFWNITSLEPGDDDLENLWESCALEDEEPFEYEFDGEVLDLDGYTDYGTCGPFQGGDVTEDGHPLNHGAYMSFFNSEYEGNGRGCLNRHLAKSDLGKGTDEDPGEIDFESVAVDCQHGKKAADGQDGLGAESSETGRAKWGDEKPGKSGDAPGHNK
jgi:hypothetical protein